ncbi:hypothetical protein scyTo_0014373 [Scyliorhinus torazame]|uniref:MARVEL domain-containing protein n=1 Tax=Scyliorhinus torazame TaxID=75743 RepID=A0A401NLF8_SCYTO|nr:hypothetical protein [Scyliorhinus torazame]
MPSLQKHSEKKTSIFIHHICFAKDFVYHFVAFVFYFGASVLEAATTAAAVERKAINATTAIFVTVLDYRQYSINVAATIFSFVVTLCYACSLGLALRRWKL